MKQSKHGVWHSILQFCKSKPIGAIGLIFLFLLLLVALFADVLAPVKMVGGTLPTDILHKLEPPYLFMDAAGRAAARESRAVYWLGTDNMGRAVRSYMI